MTTFRTLLGASSLTGDHVRVVGAGAEDRGAYTRGGDRASPVDPVLLEAAFRAGHTIVLEGVDGFWPPAERLCREIQFALRERVQANAYHTPPSARGLPLHHDAHDVLVLQLAGTKTWWLGEPVVELPVEGQTHDPDGAMLELTVHPGDALYLPRGWRHAATAGATASLHLTIGLLTRTWLDVLADTVPALRDRPAWRRSAQRSVLPDAEHAALIEQLGATAARQLESVVAADRVAGESAPADGPDPVGTEPVRVRPATLVALTTDGDRASLRFLGRCVSFPRRVRPQLDYVATRGPEPFTAADLPPGLDDAGRAVLLTRLRREGLLEPAALGSTPQTA